MFPRYFSKKPTPVSAELLAQEFHDTINLVTDDQSKVIGFIPGITIGANEGRIAPVTPTNWWPSTHYAYQTTDGNYHLDSTIGGHKSAKLYRQRVIYTQNGQWFWKSLDMPVKRTKHWILDVDEVQHGSVRKFISEGGAAVRPWRPAMTAMLSMIENQQDMYVVDEVLKAARKSYNREMGYLDLGNIFSGKA